MSATITDLGEKRRTRRAKPAAGEPVPAAAELSEASAAPPEPTPEERAAFEATAGAPRARRSRKNGASGPIDADAAKRVVAGLNATVQEQEASGARPRIAEAAAAEVKSLNRGAEERDASPGPEQGRLIPDTRLRIEEVRISLDELPPDSAFVGVTRDTKFAQLTEEMREYGLLQPIIVTKRSGKWDVGDGQRRVAAARVLAKSGVDGFDPLKAWHVWNDDGNVGPWANVLPIVLNHMRRPNPASDVRNVSRAMADGYDTDAIAEASGLTVQAVDRLATIAGLPKPLLTAFYDARMTPRVAAAIAGLPQPSQERLTALFRQRKGVANALTMEDVRAERERLAAESGAHQADLGLDEPTPITVAQIGLAGTEALAAALRKRFPQASDFVVNVSDHSITFEAGGETWVCDLIVRQDPGSEAGRDES